MFKLKVRIPLMFLSVLAIYGCGSSPDERFDSGYDDGFAEGYNTTCKIRATIVEGDWEDEDYSLGYREGNAAGAKTCRDKD
ncbi:hypothetical protein [Brumicola pallidula]|jgi:hypothetical protein|uniref:Lipoprotein n=1 Tax=Brumicola pallidula DSM 14239 = ACAM 615 TaxID=1121922 RepID=K6ZFX6_9ALTE|nr:hypothetical protein [Glaciecola pallidula]GAC27813.1 hypothetical protein GPAL_0933 [Glaciecola pallidula DSM 14239 = ACAM 615]